MKRSPRPTPRTSHRGRPHATTRSATPSAADSRWRRSSASGGFSKVYRVRDVVEGEERALKLFDNAAGYDAVRREIGALRKVDHPNVVKVIWADRTDHGEWYLIMEYVEGELLADYATGKKHLRDREAIDVALDVLDALIAIHPDTERLEELDQKKREGEITAEEYDELMALSENALVHRDIKPQNIMLTRSGAKLLDFNIASRVGDPVKTVSGTPPYQPPDADSPVGRVHRPLRRRRDALRAALRRRAPLLARPADTRRRAAGPPPIPQRPHDGLADFLVRACAAASRLVIRQRRR